MAIQARFVHTNIIAAAGGWIDGVYVITDGQLKQAGDVG